MIKAVFIDIDNTLLDFGVCVENAMRFGFAERGVEFKDDMLDTFYEINNSLWQKIEKGTLTFERLLEIRWKIVFEELKIDLDGPEFEKYFRECLKESAVPMNGALELLKYLSAKYRLFAASNGPYEQQVTRLEKAGMKDFFEDIFTSGKIGFEKPNKKFFEYCFENIHDIFPDESVMLGDSLSSDMIGGHDFKMKTLWLNIKGEDKPKWVDDSVNLLYEVKNIL